jgi:hypothetical protein
MNEPGDLSPELLARIEAYYAGELPAAEAERLRQALNANPDLARRAAEWEAVYRHGLLREDPAEREEDDRLREHLRQHKATTTPPRATRRALPLKWLGLAAGILLLLLAGYFILEQPSAEERLAGEYFTWIPREDNRLGPENAAEQGLSAYDVQDYERAYPLLLEAVERGSLDRINLLYAAVAALATDRPAEARAHLEDLLESGQYPYDEGNIRYQLALLELEAGNRAAARDQLTRVPADRSRIAERARELLTALDELPED